MKGTWNPSYSAQPSFGPRVDYAHELLRHKEEILQRWEIQVRREVASAKNESQPLLRNSLPQFLEEVADSLLHRNHHPPQECHAPAEHGKQRIHQTDYRLDEVVREYRTLRQVIFEVLEREELMAPEARNIILDNISLAVETATREYNQQQAERVDQERVRLQAVIEQLPAAVWVAEAPSGRLVHLNSRTNSWLKNPGRVSDINSYEVYQGFTPEGRAYSAEDWPMARALRNGERVDNEEIRMLAADGTWRDYLVSAAPIYDDQGKLVNGVTVAMDVTDQRRADLERRASEKRLQLALKAGNLGTFEWNVETGEHIWSGQTEAIYGFAPGTFPGNLEAIGDRIAPEDREHARAELEAAMRELREYEITTRLRHPDGSVHWVRARGRPVVGEGRVKKVVGVAWDLTDQMEKEEALRVGELRFRTLANAFPSMIAHVNRSQTVLFANRAYAEWYGLRPDQVIGRRLQEILLPETYERVKPAFEEALSGKTVRAELELMFPSGRRFVTATYVPELTAQGEVNGFFGLVHDISELRRNELKLQESLRELEQLQELRERFTSALTHDLRNPLSAARLSAELAVRFKENPTARDRALARMEDSLARVDQMITDLLDANRIKAGERIPLRMEACDLGSLAEQCLEELSVTYGERFQLEKLGDLAGRWSCTGLRRVIDNLVSNAAKYGDKERPITVRAEGREATVELSVHNWGEPIPPHEIGRLFEPFHRARAAEASGHKGWGIGLTLVKGIVEAHGGEVRAESAEGYGTCFRVLLPRQPA